MQGHRIHGFVPTKCAEEFQFILSVGKVYSIKNFDVQIYKQTEKFRVLRNATQLVFNQDTIIQQLADDGVTIPANAFDFYDHSQLEELSKQTTYLAGNLTFLETVVFKIRCLVQAHFVVCRCGGNH